MKIQDFDYSVNLLEAIIWQYNNAINIISILQQKQEWYDENQTQFWEDWYRDVFNLQTANEFGLTVWSIILNLPLFVQVNPDPPGKPIFGFNEDPSINDHFNFNNGNFSNDNSSVFLTIEQQRIVLKLRYFQLCTRGDITDINNFLNFLWGDQGGAWALDGLNMTMRYVFNFNASTNLISILKSYDLLPRPATVGVEYVIDNGQVFGFGEFYQNFNNGNFYPIIFS